jgi:hypothetical protein
MTKDEAILNLVKSAICSRNVCDNCQYHFLSPTGSSECACDFTYETINEAMAVLGYSFTEKY